MYANAYNAEDFIKDYGLIVYSETVQTIDDGRELDWKNAWKTFLRE